jgi:hypothetical protein
MLEELIGRRYDWSALRATAFALQRARYSDSAMAAGVAGVYDEVLGNA